MYRVPMRISIYVHVFTIHMYVYVHVRTSMHVSKQGSVYACIDKLIQSNEIMEKKSFLQVNDLEEDTHKGM